MTTTITQNEGTGNEVMLTAAQLASRLGVCTATVYRAAWRGEITSFRVGRSRRFEPSAVEQMRDNKASSG